MLLAVGIVVGGPVAVAIVDALLAVAWLDPYRESPPEAALALDELHDLHDTVPKRGASARQHRLAPR